MQTELIGLIVDLSENRRGRPCCGNHLAQILPGKGPHAAELRCTRCDKHVNWISKSTGDWIAQVIQTFGKPEKPIVIRTPAVRP
jgi:hypothetical protein